ncbi:hypothetical protein [Buchananella hordeovulneris]|uniref:Multidrug ABC transporter permease n=1 Tax=Buchananella hordeovulneris TaxID=52770 RepID=A0A1Q5PUL7_9ACTO|nr:hypothetical protein [Buchananella hordeovulneris]OKL51257.1 hypothetical protein BSZ40_08070 [Buchananella hordeovulneris]
MTRQLRMLLFHLRQYMRVGFFVQLMAITTVSMCLTQYLGWHAWGGSTAVPWLRAGIVGLWTTCTTAAGIIGFERYKGTLIYLVSGRIHPLRATAAVVAAAATFGLAAFPLAWLAWRGLLWLSGQVPAATGLTVGQLLVGVGLLWLGALAISLVIASLFVLTPNAIAYEGLLLVPVFFASGVLFTAGAAPTVVAAIGQVLPITPVVGYLLQPTSTPLAGAALHSVGLTVVWGLAAAGPGTRALRLARRRATLEMI